MSTDTPNSNTNEPAVDQGQGQSGIADGSPRSDPPDVEAQAGGSESSAQAEADREEVSRPDEVTRLMAEITRRDDELQRARDMLDAIDADPVASKEAHRAVRGQPPASDEDRITVIAREKFGNLDENGAWAKALTEFGRTIREETLADVERRIGPRLQGLDRTLSGTRFEKSLVANGVDADTVIAPEFRAFVKEQMASDRTFKTLHDKAPETAAELAAVRWTSRAGRRAMNAAERRRVELSKGAQLNRGAPRGSASASETFKLKRHAPDRAARLTELLNRGVDPSQIDFE